MSENYWYMQKIYRRNDNVSDRISAPIYYGLLSVTI